MSRPIKRWNTDPGSSPEPELIYPEQNQVGPDYVYGAEAIAAFREDLGLLEQAATHDEGPESVGSGYMMMSHHACKRPSAYDNRNGAVFYCEGCGRFSLVERYMPPGRYARPYKYRWRHAGPIKQWKLEREYLR